MNTLQTILVVDDDKVNRMLLNRFLSEDYNVIEAQDGKSALEILTSNRKKISGAILDLQMSGIDGYQVLKEINNNPKIKNIPVIVSTESNIEDDEIRALRYGAWDFVSKPYQKETIKFRLQNAIQRSQLSAFNQLKYLSEYDSLTGIYNKNKFYEMTHKMLKTYKDKKFIFVRLDIDRFNLINSYYGTDEGDRLLKFLAKKIAKYCEKYDYATYGRIEADIFAFCVPFENKEKNKQFIESTIKEIKKFNFEFDLVPTFGFYVIDDNLTSVNNLFDKANLAAKTCKGNYFNCYAYYDKKMGQAIEKEQEIVNDMNDALEKEQFCVFLQPKFDLQSNCFAGAEALVRWFHPTKGVISPGDFIPVFERNGFIAKLDYYVLEKSCQLIKKWIDSGIEPSPISVNISRVDLYNPMLVENICGLTKKYGIPNKYLNIELTESAYTDNPDAMIKTMDKFHEEGFVVMMDDFGSGYSSLNILKDVTVDVLKIDMRFLSKTKIEGRGENIIASVIRMAKWLKIPSIAEGVETKEQVEFLRGIGCEYIQGFYYAKPMPVSEYEVFTGKHFNEAKRKNEYEDFDTNSIWSNNPHFQRMISSFNHPVVLYEFDGHDFEIIRANDAYCDAFGFSDLNYNHKSSIWYIVPEYRPVVLNTFNSAVKNKTTASCEVQRTVEGKQDIWISMKVKYVNNIGNKAVLLGSIEDITTHKEIDFELQKYRIAIERSKRSSKTIMIVDDVELTRGLLKGILEEEYTVLMAKNGEEAINILQKEEYDVDLIVLGLIMPVMNGSQFLEYRQKHLQIGAIPVIVIFDDNSTKNQIDILSLGANDFITKPFVPEIVKKRVSNVIGSYIAYGNVLGNSTIGEFDALTGLCSSQNARNIINSILSDANSKNTMAIINIDEFSRINEKYGHLVGDEVIRKLSDKLKRSFRDSDVITRLDADEFIVFVTSTENEEYVSGRIAKLLGEIEDNLIQHEKVSCSFAVMSTGKKVSSFHSLYKAISDKLKKTRKRK